VLAAYQSVQAAGAVELDDLGRRLSTELVAAGDVSERTTTPRPLIG
jgi:hypothetical protein